MTTDNQAYGSYVALTVTGLNALASSATVGWQSDQVVNTSTLADDYEILINFAAPAASAPANDKALYFYVCPWVNSGSLVAAGNLGTTTLPTGTNGAATIGTSANLKGPYVINYVITSQPFNGYFTIGSMCGGVVPDAFSIIVINFTGAALASSNTTNVIGYRPITWTNT